MTIDRARGIRRAEVFLRQGRLEEAVAEYARLAQERPEDWAILNALGNLHLRARRAEPAAEQFCRLAEHLHGSGDSARALEIYSRFLRLLPSHAQIRLGAASTLKAIAAEASAAGRAAEAIASLRRALEYDPSDTLTRLQVVRGSLDAGDVATARACLSNTAATPALLLCQLEVALIDGNAPGARTTAQRLLREPRAPVGEVVRLAEAFAARSREAAFACIELAVDRAVQEQDWPAAAGALQEFVAHVPGHVPALMRMVEVCVDGVLEADLRNAQRLLADAYLQNGQAREARVIAEDLALGEPWDRGNIERFRRALVMLGEEDPDAIIADRLSGDSPFAGLELLGSTDEAPTSPESVPAPAAPAPVPASRGEDARQATSIKLPPELSALAVTAEQRAALAHYAAGRTAEAVAVLQRAVRSPAHRFESAMLLGRLQEGSGDLHEAIEWYERATQAAPARGAAHDVLYDLGRLLLATGEGDRALAVFLELRAEVPNYRDVSWQIARLRHAREGARPSARAAG